MRPTFVKSGRNFITEEMRDLAALRNSKIESKRRANHLQDIISRGHNIRINYNLKDEFKLFLNDWQLNGSGIYAWYSLGKCWKVVCSRELLETILNKFNCKLISIYGKDVTDLDSYYKEYNVYHAIE